MILVYIYEEGTFTQLGRVCVVLYWNCNKGVHANATCSVLIVDIKGYG